MHDVAVIGGGPAGMAAAWHLRDLDLVLLEERPRLGGRLYSEPRGEYWLNLGGHLFPSGRSHVREVISGLGLRTVAIPGSKTSLEFGGKVYSPRRVEAYPFVLPMTVRERVALARAGLRLAAGVRGRRPAPDGSFADLLGPLPARVDAILRAAGRRACAELEQQSASVGLSLFGTLWGDGADGVTLSVNLDGGSGRWADAMSGLLGERARLGARVVSVTERDGHQLVVYQRDGREETLRARQVVVAVPAPAAAAIASEVPEPVARCLAGIGYGAFVCAGVITKETGAMPWDDIYALVSASSCFDMWFNHANPLRTGGHRADGGSLMCYAGGAPAAAFLELEESEIASLMLADMLRIFPRLDGNIEETKVQKWERGNVYRRPGEDRSALHDYANAPGRAVHLAGDYFGDLGNMEVAAGAGAAAAEKVRHELTRAR